MKKQSHLYLVIAVLSLITITGCRKDDQTTLCFRNLSVYNVTDIKLSGQIVGDLEAGETSSPVDVSTSNNSAAWSWTIGDSSMIITQSQVVGGFSLEEGSNAIFEWDGISHTIRSDN